jgi:hypothetical protein
MKDVVERLAQTMSLGALLDEVRDRRGSYELLEHWQQGEFHHDVVLRMPPAPGADGAVLVVATNCNGGVKEVIAFERVPQRYALWHWRCPHVQDFAGELPPILARAATTHHFDPCELLKDDARSELLPAFREREEGGGWRMLNPDSDGRSTSGKDRG